ncbi:hypothetical protein HY414_01055 [Candidatus Kaiserbacteria bacterium]|nr:hypothetical protein [Candidatus Kaiserbacteria bacterium]
MKGKMAMIVCYPSLGKTGKAADADLGDPLSHPVVRQFILTMRTGGKRAAREYLRDACITGRYDENW